MGDEIVSEYVVPPSHLGRIRCLQQGVHLTFCCEPVREYTILAEASLCSAVVGSARDHSMPLFGIDPVTLGSRHP